MSYIFCELGVDTYGTYYHFPLILGHMTSSVTLVSCPFYFGTFCKPCLLPESELCDFLHAFGPQLSPAPGHSWLQH